MTKRTVVQLDLPVWRRTISARHSGTIAAAVALALYGSQPDITLAQQAASGGGLEEVVVTATR